jgi:hypothetical protein
MLRTINLGLRFLLELAALAALGYWGFTTGPSGLVRLGLCVGTPLVAAAVWGAFIAPKAPYPPARPIRLLLEVLVFGSAALALVLAGQTLIGLFFAALVLANELLLFLWGQW